MRAGCAYFLCDLAVRAITHEDAFAHNVPLLAGHPMVSVAGCPKGLRFAVVGHETDVRRAVSKGPSLFSREKAGAGVVGFVPKRAVELARMAAGLMHRERQMFRIEDEIVQTR